MKIALNDVNKVSAELLVDEYEINTSEVELADGTLIDVWCWDDSIDTLFIESGVKIGNRYNKEKVFNFDEDYEPVGLDYNDYIETVELIQNGISYFFPIYCAFNGCGAEDAIAIFNPVNIEK